MVDAGNDFVPCPYCTAEVPLAATICVACGAEVRKIKRDGTRVFESPADRSRRYISRTVLAIVAVALAAIFIVGFVRATDDADKDADCLVTAIELNLDPDTYCD